jgi:hypothetical protein
MKLLRRQMLFAVCIFIGGSVSGRDLVIGHVGLHLGMPQTEALAALGKEFDAKQVSVAEGKFLLWTREPETHVQYSAGTVSFRDGKLYRASKAWGVAGIKGKETTEGLFGVLSEIAGKDGKPCLIKTETLRVPARYREGVDVKLITIEIPPDRRVMVKIFEPHVSPDGQDLLAGPEVDEDLVDLAK